MSDLVWGDTVTRDEFDRALHLGLGRTVLWLRAHPSSEFRDLILHACMHHLAFDGQSEGSREDYLFDLVQASGEPDWYYDQIVAGLMGTRIKEISYEQVLEMLCLWAEHGHPTAREVLYTGFVNGCRHGDHDGYEALVKLDGIDGVIFVADQFGQMTLEPLDYWYYPWLLECAQEQGVAEPLEILRSASLSRPAIATFLKRLVDENAHQDGIKNVPMRDPATVTYVEFMQPSGNEKPAYRRIPSVMWGGSASEADLRLAAADLLAETDPAKLRRLLAVFWERQFPLDPDPIIALVSHPAPRIAVIAMGALVPLPPHPNVRALAESLLADSDQMAAYAVRLLKHQFQPGDHALVEGLAARLTDTEAWHTFNFYALDFYALDFYQDYPDPAGEARVMLALYEHNPCANCRKNIVQRLIALNALPDWMAAECRLDASQEIRKVMDAYDHPTAPALADAAAPA